MSIKKIIVGGVEHQIDYTALENLPFAPGEISKLKSILPIYAHFTVAEDDIAKINKVHIHKYACPERFDDEPEGYKVENGKLDQATIIARDGDFGYHAIDGTGQINFTVEFKDAFKNGYVVIPVITPVVPAEKPYSNFKSKYSTGLNCPLGTAYDYAGLVTDGIYRITKITTDLEVELHVYKESELPAHTITYNIVNADNVNAVVTVYRCADGIEKVAKYGIYDSSLPVSDLNPKNGYPKEFQKVLEFENGTAVDCAYDDGSGFRSNATFAEGAAYLQFTVTGLPEGYKATAEISGTKGVDHNGLEYSTDFGGYFKGKKIANDLTVTITVSDAVNVSYVKPEGAYEFDAEVLPTASKRADFTFDVYYNIDKSNNNENKQLLPNPATLLNRIASITSDGVALTAGEDYYIDYAVDNNKFQTYSQGTKPNKVEWWILSDGKFANIAETETGSGLHEYGHFEDNTFVVESTKTENELESLKVKKYSKGLSGKKVTITIDHTKITGDLVVTTAVPANE